MPPSALSLRFCIPFVSLLNFCKYVCVLYVRLSVSISFKFYAVSLSVFQVVTEMTHFKKRPS